MAAPATSSDFLELLRTSGIVDDKRIDAYLQRIFGDAGWPADPRHLAGSMVRDGLLTGFQSQQLLQGHSHGFMLGMYRVLDRLGSGGMAVVYLCEHKFMRRLTAVKVLPAASANDLASLERFYREARAVAALDHPNIVRAYDINQDGNVHFLVMEYVDGASLQDIVGKHGPMDIHRACHYICQAAIGLQHAHHAAGLVHRDIKPGNLLVDRLGTVKILDMGLARFFHDEEDNLTRDHDETVLGTTDYMAPEQALDSHSVDIRADIYSLGATFYFLLTGTPPFAGGTVAQKLIWHQMKEPRPIGSIRAEVPAELVCVVERMMAKTASRRFQVPAEVVEGLVPWTQTPVPPPPEKEMPRLSSAALNRSGCSIELQLGGADSPASGRELHPSWTPPNQTTPVPPADDDFRIQSIALRGNDHWGQPTEVPSVTPLAQRAEPVFDSPEPTKVLSAPVTRAISAEDQVLLQGARIAMASPAVAMAEPVETAPTSRARLLAGKRRLWLILAVTGALIAGGVLLFRSLSTPRPKPADEVVNHQARTLHVSQAGMAGAYKTIHDAVRAAGAGDHIWVRDERIEEQLVLDGSELAKDLTIEAAAKGKPVVWICPEDPHDGKFIALTNTAGLHIKGFLLDGRERVPDLMTVTGHCPGLVLEDIQMQGGTRGGLALWNCTGTDHEQGAVTFRALHFVTTKPLDYAIGFHTDPKSALAHEYIDLTDCRLEGAFQADVRIAAPLHDIRFARNRLFQPTDGLVYEKSSPGGPAWPIQFTLESNTFVDVKQAGLHFVARPHADKGSRVVLRNNLFARTANLIRVDVEMQEAARRKIFEGCEGNVCDKTSKEGNLPLQATVMDFTLPAEPQNEAQFLRYDKSSPLNQAGANQTPVGVPPS